MREEEKEISRLTLGNRLTEGRKRDERGGRGAFSFIYPEKEDSEWEGKKERAVGGREKRRWKTFGERELYSFRLKEVLMVRKVLKG